MDLRGAICIVTGGSRGIGRALCRDLEARGAVVVSCSLGGGGDDASDDSFAVDVRDSAQVKRFFGEVVSRHGGIDVLICNAGYASRIQDLDEVSDAEFERLFQTNVAGVFHCLREAIPVLRARRAGVIVTIGSRAGTRAHAGLALYSASKFAVRGITQGLAKELCESAPHVRCYTVSPGGVNTPMRAELFGAEDSERQQSAESVAKVVCDLIEEKVEAPTGANIEVAGGLVARIEEMA